MDFKIGSVRGRGGEIAAILCLALGAQAQVALDAPTDRWTAVVYPNSLHPDPYADQQTGSREGDLVGNLLHPAFYTLFDGAGTASPVDGTLAFRARIGADKNPAGFATALFVGMDADSDGDLDLFLGVNNSGSKDTVGLWAPGTGANTSPSTTTLQATPLSAYIPSAATYDWRAVSAAADPTASSFDLDGGGDTDRFLSFAVPFADVVGALSLQGISIDQNTHVRYVMATATQANSLNQDLNGVAGSVNSSMTWAQLGVASTPITPTGMLPEPSTALLILVGGLGMRIVQRRRA